MKKRLSLILVLALIITSLPVFAFAAEEDGNEDIAGGSTPAAEKVLTAGDEEPSEDITVSGGAEEPDPAELSQSLSALESEPEPGTHADGWDGDSYWRGGVMLTGMQLIDGKVYYLKEGVKTVVNGWINVDGSTYYGYSSGTFANSPVRIKGTKTVKVKKKVKSKKKRKKKKYKYVYKTVATNYLYMFGADGKLDRRTGLYTKDGKEYYGIGGGVLKTGWAAVGNNAMYFYPSNGSMAKKTKIGYLKIPANGRLGRAYALGVRQLDKSGWSLKKAYKFSYKLRYSGRSYRTKTSEQYAIRGFTRKKGNCYVMAATFYIQAKLLGYDVHQVAGRVDLPHSWTVIRQNGREYVYDPNFKNETGRNGYKIWYGKKGTWRYRKYHKMN